MTRAINGQSELSGLWRSDIGFLGDRVVIPALFAFVALPAIDHSCLQPD